ncbi:MAG: hypothetical protein J3Q66DRAFT_367891 [Benniella sp.]|nr:MAG: hypothetical protein J3Q66DRAFT_367891 [Benniella sp.]
MSSENMIRPEAATGTEMLLAWQKPPHSEEDAFLVWVLSSSPLTTVGTTAINATTSVQFISIHRTLKKSVKSPKRCSNFHVSAQLLLLRQLFTHVQTNTVIFLAIGPLVGVLDETLPELTKPSKPESRCRTDGLEDGHVPTRDCNRARFEYGWEYARAPKPEFERSLFGLLKCLKMGVIATGIASVFGVGWFVPWSVNIINDYSKYFTLKCRAKVALEYAEYCCVWVSSPSGCSWILRFCIGLEHTSVDESMEGEGLQRN